MAGPYAPQLTRWRTAVGGGVVRDFVEHAGNVIALRPEDYYHRIGSSAATGEDDDDDLRERVLLGGRLYPVADETMIHGGGGGGRTLRCVEFCPEPGVAPLRLTVTRTAAGREEKKQQEVAEVVSPDGAVRVLGFGECYGDGGGGGGESGTVQHVVDVEGEREVFVLLVSVRQELARIVRVQRLT